MYDERTQERRFRDERKIFWEESHSYSPLDMVGRPLAFSYDDYEINGEKSINAINPAYREVHVVEIDNEEEKMAATYENIKAKLILRQLVQTETYYEVSILYEAHSDTVATAYKQIWKAIRLAGRLEEETRKDVRITRINIYRI